MQGGFGPLQAPSPLYTAVPCRLLSRLSHSRSCTSRCKRPAGLPECRWAWHCWALVGRRQSRWDSDLRGGWWRCRWRPCCGPWRGRCCLPCGSARGRTPGLPDAESGPVSAGWPSAAGSWGSSSRPLLQPAASASRPAEWRTRRNCNTEREKENVKRQVRKTQKKHGWKTSLMSCFTSWEINLRYQRERAFCKIWGKFLHFLENN